MNSDGSDWNPDGSEACCVPDDVRVDSGTCLAWMWVLMCTITFLWPCALRLLYLLTRAAVAWCIRKPPPVLLNAQRHPQSQDPIVCGRKTTHKSIVCGSMVLVVLVSALVCAGIVWHHYRDHSPHSHGANHSIGNHTNGSIQFAATGNFSVFFPTT